MGLLLGQVSKWRAQRADRGAHAARGFVGGTTDEYSNHMTGGTTVSMPHAALWVVQLGGIEVLEIDSYGFNAARGFVGGAAGIRACEAHARLCFNAARGFVGGAASRILPLKVG